ncbi:hypothetical protein G195_000021 [Phytophthora kernoviae 00238/432]|uniref:Methionine synthase n=1 Tax=Phytophthora kernoviae 00238/432 TaxID=1284355 RepID=A0A8J4SDZ0_9STRA|nr:hypothetical protein G195_000021 [Phytophthora kernoviae 00238/432]
MNGTHPPALSGIDPVYVEQDNRPYMVGERTNVLGSRKFKRLIVEGKYEEASEIARAQVKNGAHVVDVCVQDPDREEAEDMEKFLELVVKKVKVPLMIDTTDAAVIDLALQYSQGKAIINSINLEDGEEKFELVTPLLHKYGGAVVVGTIDERGQAISREDKLEVAKRSYDLLVNKYGLKAEDLIFDTLVFPVGLDYAIVNTEKLERYASISEEERRLSEELLYNTNDETLAAFVAAFRNKKVEKKEKISNLSLEERLASYVVEGSKEGLLPDLEQALTKYTALEVINGPLMRGMEEVGRLFNNNELIVAEVLQSAEVMKASVAYLEQFMEKNETSVKGKIILATVKGDVHDIGKNLVEIILSNNGYRIINLGIKVPPERIIEAYREEKVDAIGLSGLLVKSAQQMILTAQDLRTAGIDVPIMVGGAALTRKFTKNRIRPEYNGMVVYAKDAMDGLDLANKLMNPSTRQVMQLEMDAEKEADAAGAETVTSLPELTRVERSDIAIDNPVLVPPDLERHVMRNYPLSHILPYVNMQMLLGHHLGLRGSVEQLLASGDQKATDLKAVVDDIMQEAVRDGIIQAHAMYRFFPAQSSGNSVIIYDPENTNNILHTFTFPRQKVEPFLCLSDFLKPVESGQMDYVGFMVVTAGHGDIGVELTEGFMMEPEASVSAMVFSHPQAKYFNVDKA